MAVKGKTKIMDKSLARRAFKIIPKGNLRAASRRAARRVASPLSGHAPTLLIQSRNSINLFPFGNTYLLAPTPAPAPATAPAPRPDSNAPLRLKLFKYARTYEHESCSRLSALGSRHPRLTRITL